LGADAVSSAIFWHLFSLKFSGLRCLEFRYRRCRLPLAFSVLWSLGNVLQVRVPTPSPPPPFSLVHDTWWRGLIPCTDLILSASSLYSRFRVQGLSSPCLAPAASSPQRVAAPPAEAETCTVGNIYSACVNESHPLLDPASKVQYFCNFRSSA
jgi:hypothetical protein